MTVATWNVWFDAHRREERNRLLLAELAELRPHLIALQEVTPPFVRALQASGLLEEYWLSAEHHSQLGVVMIGRIPVRQLQFVPLPSGMGRRLLVADLGDGLRVASSHFESTAQGRDRRLEQLSVAFETLRPAPHSVLLGDFNFTDGNPEEAGLDPAFLDVWRSLQGDKPGYTRDPQTNPMVGSNSSPARLDRIYVRGTRPDSVRLLGTTSPVEGLLPSDHFGLAARLRPT